MLGINSCCSSSGVTLMFAMLQWLRKAVNHTIFWPRRATVLQYCAPSRIVARLLIFAIVGRWMLGVGCWVLDVGRWMLGVGCWMMDVG